MTKGRRTKKQDTPPWMLSSQAKVAEFFGVSPRTVDSWRRSGMPGENGKWNLQKILFWLRTSGPWRPKVVVDDAMMQGGDSPALERFRLARARIAENELARQEGTLVDQDVMKEILGLWAAVNRRFALKLQKEFGPRGRELYDEWLNSSEKTVRNFFGDEKLG